VRFALDDPFLTGVTKTLRHDWQQRRQRFRWPIGTSARDTAHDVGTEISSADECQRTDAWAVFAASLKRTEHHFAALEEYGKLVDAQFARQMEGATLTDSIRSKRQSMSAGRAETGLDGAAIVCAAGLAADRPTRSSSW